MSFSPSLYGRLGTSAQGGSGGLGKFLMSMATSSGTPESGTMAGGGTPSPDTWMAQAGGDSELAGKFESLFNEQGAGAFNRGFMDVLMGKKSSQGQRNTLNDYLAYSPPPQKSGGSL